MSALVECPSCSAGDHTGHDGSHHGLPGVLGGHYCGCRGECVERGPTPSLWASFDLPDVAETTSDYPRN